MHRILKGSVAAAIIAAAGVATSGAAFATTTPNPGQSSTPSESACQSVEPGLVQSVFTDASGHVQVISVDGHSTSACYIALPAGQKGDTGAQGIQGLTGPQGAPGATGPAGPIGLPGATGATGATGAAGKDGAPGVKGDTGPQGIQGPQGETGATGPAGADAPVPTFAIDDNGDLIETLAGVDTDLGHVVGSNGMDGKPGADGVSITGQPGTPGAAGATGPTGPKGATGAAGKAGSNGAQGVQGRQGATGATGAKGATGQAGAAGKPGASTQSVTPPPSNAYYEVARDGGVFAFNGAHFYGSLPQLGVKVSDIVNIVIAKNDTGYWLIGADGRSYGFGHVLGSPNPDAGKLNQPMVAGAAA